MNTASRPLKTYIVLVHNGFGYEYGDQIQAASVREARAMWKRRGDWKTVNFRVSEVRR